MLTLLIGILLGFLGTRVYDLAVMMWRQNFPD